MALTAARYLAGSYSLLISVPRGPLTESFAEHGELVRSSPSLPLWGAPPWRWLLQAGRTAFDAVRLAVLIRRRGVRLVVTNSTVLLSPVLAARLARVPVVVHAREWSRDAPGRVVHRLEGTLADAIVAISGGIGDRFRGARARVVRIPDGIELPRTPEAFQPPSSPNGDGREVPLRLCTVGALTAALDKGQDVAVEALVLLHRRGVAATLDLVGPIHDAAAERRLLAAAERGSVSDRVRLHGATDDVPAFLRRSDVLLFCSRDGADVTPLVLMEALVHGRPVVATNVGSVSEVVIDGETGLLVPPGRPEAIAAAVARLAADPALGRVLVERGQGHVAERYDIDNTLDSLRRELEHHLESKAGGRAFLA